jgi:hypothetical protein
MFRRTFLLLGTGFLLCSYFNTAAAEPDKSDERQLHNRREINALIDSLANHNPKPQWADVQSRIARASGNPLFSKNYGWKEDNRVRRVVEELSKADKEDLWWCLMEHLDDEKYAISYAFNQYARVASIGFLCSDAAFDALQGFYWHYSPGSENGATYRPLQVIRSYEELKDWYQKHKNIPLYQQQIELGEAALKKIRDLDPVIQKERGISEEEKYEYITHIKKQLEKLRDTKKPILDSLGLLNRVDDFYDAKVAKEIRDKYQEKPKGKAKTTMNK